MEQPIPQSLINGNINIKNRETGQTHRTSIRLERIEWDAMRRICSRNKISIHAFCSQVDQHPARKEHSRTSRIRSAILQHYLNKVIDFESIKEIKQQQGQSQKRQQGGHQYSPRNLPGRTTIA